MSSPRHCTKTRSLPRSYLRGVQSFHDLDPVSKLRFSAFQNRFFKNFEGMYYSRREGILSTELWNEIERTMSDFLAYDGVRQWWETRKHWHTEAFVGVVDAIIARGEKPTAYSNYNLKISSCLKTANERNSRMAANCNRRRGRGRWVFRRNVCSRGRADCFHRAKTFR